MEQKVSEIWARRDQTIEELEYLERQSKRLGPGPDRAFLELRLSSAKARLARYNKAFKVGKSQARKKTWLLCPPVNLRSLKLRWM